MLKRRIHILAVTGITIVAATIVTLTSTAAYAATTTASAPGHVTAPQAQATSGCVTVEFGIWDENTYEQCVRDEQILLNNLYYNGIVYVNQGLTVDGYYGPDTYSAVRSFQTDIPQPAYIDGITGPQTWWWLCHINSANGFSGVYWHDAGCATEPGSPPS
jgi:peptidoglycan hydrolase-like protein with peptidoglycan-binding domain